MRGLKKEFRRRAAGSPIRQAGSRFPGGLRSIEHRVARTTTRPREPARAGPLGQAFWTQAMQ
jgi:hypothetical protein